MNSGACGVDDRWIETTSLPARLLMRLRGEQTLQRFRKRGLRAEPPIRMSSGAIVDPDFAWAVEIGAHTIIAHDVRIIAHDAAIKRLTGYTEVCRVKIGERCYIGAGAIVLPGAVIGDDAIVGAGALVRGNIPPGTVAVGNPAKVIGSIADLHDRHVAQMERAPQFERRAAQFTRDDIQEMQHALAKHGRIYVL
jgi:maltose O-acetyltransferase